MQHETETIHAPQEGVFSSIKNFTASLVTHLHTRLQLFATELAEEKLRITSILFCVLAAVFFFIIATILTAVFVIAAAWDTPYRLHAVGGLILAFLVGAAIFGNMVRGKLKAKPHLFQASLAELYKDQQQLRSL